MIVAAAVLPVACASPPDNSALRGAAKENLFTLETALRAWAQAHHDRYPAPERLTADDFGKAAGMGRWPANPWTGERMAQSTAPGDFTYGRAAGGKIAELTAYGADGPLSRVELGVSSP
jgi:hypothetical protein